MSPRLNDPDWEPDLYETPCTSSEPLGPLAVEPAHDKKAISVTHDLTDGELRRFVNFDLYYDPMPLLGFIPQWVLLYLIFGVVGAGVGLMAVKFILPSILEPMTTSRDFREVSSALVRVINFCPPSVGVIATPPIFLGIFQFVAARRRSRARALGLCRGRTVTISPLGLSVQIPAAIGTMVAIGPGMRLWSDIRKITNTEDDLTFWMRPTPPFDWEGRARVIVPLRVFADGSEAAVFVDAARRWHAVASSGDAQWWDEADL